MDDHKLMRMPGRPEHEYVRVTDDLRRRIEAGEWEIGGRMPSELDLVAEYEVSRTTIRRAADILAKEGLIEIRQGLGTFVAPP